MIRFFKENDKNALLSLWKEAFGDDERTILRHLEMFGEYILVYEEENLPVSMLTLFPVTANSEKGRYIYAVATKKNSRNRGFAGKLIEYAKEYVKSKGEKFLVLLPQNDSLYGFYEKFGFSELKCVKRIEKGCFLNETADFSVKKITPAEYYKCRNNYFGGTDYVVWDGKMLEYIEDLYNGSFCEILKSSERVACAFCYKNGKKLVIPELLAEADADGILASIMQFFGADAVKCIKSEKDGERRGMVYPKSCSGIYFGIGMN